METPEPVIVDWPSLLFALMIDSLLVWVPAIWLFFFAPDDRIVFAFLLMLAALAVNCDSYARGTTLGTYSAGFRLRTRRRKPPGMSYGLVLTLLTAVSFAPTNNAAGPLGRPHSHPLIGNAHADGGGFRPPPTTGSAGRTDNSALSESSGQGAWA